MGLCRKFCVGALLLVAFAWEVSSFYLPGVAPQEYKKKELVPLFVNKLNSVKTQLPYEYYDAPFCKPDVVEDVPENLGEILSGDVINNSPYQFFMQVPQKCKVLCRKELTADEANKFSTMIDQGYSSSWIIDNLPGGVLKFGVGAKDPDTFDIDEHGLQYDRALPLGGEVQGKHYLYNHIRFTIKYHQDSSSFEGSRVVGFELEPFSVRHTYSTWSGVDTQLDTCGTVNEVDGSHDAQRVDGAGEVVFSYDVLWQPSDIQWASRWDVFFHSSDPDDNVHWFAIVNALTIVLFLSAFIAIILVRTLHRDISRYNQQVLDDDISEETGWKLLHGDVFRPPQWGCAVLPVLVGTGIQLLLMTVVLMFFAVLGFLSPANRGGLMTALLLLFVFMGAPAGYSSARLYKLFLGKHWKTNTLCTALLYPGYVFCSYFVLNFFVWGERSSAAIPFTTMFALLLLWMGVSVPLVFLGSYVGFKKPQLETPLNYNQIPRQIPPRPWVHDFVPSVLLAGVLPFGAVLIELFYIMGSIWHHKIYYVFGFLLLVLIILTLTCVECAIVQIYFQLTVEDYEWWWRSFCGVACSGLYLFTYSFLYWYATLEITYFPSVVLYFGNMFVISVTFSILTGTIGFLACFLFVKKIYAAIKVD